MNRTLMAISFLFSGLCWYFGNGLNGNFWYLVWLAPIPILIISLTASAKYSFLIAFIAYLIGRLSWFSYLTTVATLIPAIIFTLLLPLIFAFIIVITRKTVLKTNSFISIFVFPVFFTTFEFLLCSFSKDGTAGSIAYSQLNFLPLVQIASITGLLGITFFVTFLPSLIAIGWHNRKEKLKLRTILFIGVIMISSVLLFDIVRLNKQQEKEAIIVGLISPDEKSLDMSNHPDFNKSISVAEYYAQQIKRLALQGAKIIVLPERAININNALNTYILQILSDAAKANRVTITTGYTNFKNKDEHNSALVIDDSGNVITDYNKVHLVTGLETQFVPGNSIGLFEHHKTLAGIAICKDLDYNNYIRKYGNQNINFLLIPAWDFITDDWLHSRMAILRGVENGFSEVRTARQGRLTISDPYGRVNAEANCSNGNATTLTGRLKIYQMNTFYNHYGEWFGFVCLLSAIYFLIIAIKKIRY